MEGEARLARGLQLDEFRKHEGLHQSAEGWMPRRLQSPGSLSGTMGYSLAWAKPEWSPLAVSGTTAPEMSAI